MNRKLALIILFLTGTAAADENAGLEIGVRTGFALPFGKLVASDHDSMSDVMSGAVPLWLDVAYRIDRRFSVGAYGQAALVLPKGCSDDDGCSATDYRFGLEGRADLAPDARFAPWVAVGAGYEILSVSSSEASGSVRGFELVNVQAGADYRLGAKAAIGPFAGFSLAEYDHVAAGPFELSGFDTALHEWLTLGVRGRFDI